MTRLFENFVSRRIKTAGAEINLVTGGSGPPLLLLHGYPQTHAMWHKIAPRLAQRFTQLAVVIRSTCRTKLGRPKSPAAGTAAHAL